MTQKQIDVFYSKTETEGDRAGEVYGEACEGGLPEVPAGCGGFLYHQSGFHICRVEMSQFAGFSIAKTASFHHENWRL